ncbi:restriction endonuclease subunit S [Flavobacterium sp. W22_SRS_FP1]|uniref:restriction endonuclease subunit S n=1 Tax=Flavobacterium sp. W22_SRS_FP1 TaxID=3240276 RepID=UPI003F91D410
MKKYDSYKDSEIEWIGEVPSHWEVDKLNRIFQINTGFTPSTGNNEFYENGKHDWITIRDLEGKYVSESKTKLTDIAIKGKTIIPKGSLLYSFKLSVGQMAFTTKEIYTNEAIFSVFPSEKLNLNYYYYLLDRILIHNSNENIYGAKILNQELIKASKLLVPSEEEQTQIANYLDHKTTQIDTLISKKQQFITLLQEERIAVINQAVTKGLDPKVKMKDSGIVWLGEIPEHWGLKRIGHISKVIRGASPRPAGDPLLFNGDFLPWITVKEVTNANGKFITSTDTFLTELGAIQTRVLEPETLILSNSGATLGVPRITLIKGGINDGSVAFLNLNIERDYMYYFFTTHTNIYREEAAGYGQPNLNTEIVKSTKIPIPTAKEQQEIIEHIELELNRFDLIIKKSQQEIELLKEYKTALISEVVTGKVDVRNLIRA